MTLSIQETGKAIVDTTTTAVATTAVASPVWLPWLQEASTIAATLAPILGAIWLTVQIWAKVSETLRKKKENDG